jgi:hypothetical protein
MHGFFGTLYRLILMLEIFLNRFDKTPNLRPILEIRIMNLHVVNIIALWFVRIGSIRRVTILVI